MTLEQMGEFGLIAKLRSLVGEPGEGEVWVGDDAAVIRAPAGTIFFTTDLSIEGVHFDVSLSKAEDIGYKALAVNISDVAAMGGTPWRAVASIGIKPGLEYEWIEALYNGIREAADEFEMAVVGGDISRSECLVISIALIGNPPGRRVIERRGARVGDVIAVTGTLGASAAGLRLLRAGIRDRPDLIRAHERPTPRVREVEALRRHLPSAMIDVSDGLAADLGHLCEASGVGARLDAERLPVADIGGLGLDREPLELALYGGEDYELCFTVPEDRFETAATAVSKATTTAVTSIGEIVEKDEGLLLIEDGRESMLEAKGWDHLKL